MFWGKKKKKRKKKKDEEIDEEELTFEKESVYIEQVRRDKVKKTKDGKQKKAKAPKKVEYFYELTGYPFSVMSEIERDQLLNDFQSFISIVGEGTLLVRVEDESYQIFNETIPVTSKRFFLKTPKPDLHLFGARRLDQDPFQNRPRVVKNLYREVQLKDGRFARVLVAYRYPSVLAEGFLYATFGVADEVAFIWETVPMNKALEIIDKAEGQEGAARERQQNGEGVPCSPRTESKSCGWSGPRELPPDVRRLRKHQRGVEREIFFADRPAQDVRHRGSSSTVFPERPLQPLDECRGGLRFAGEEVFRHEIV